LSGYDPTVPVWPLRLAPLNVGGPALQNAVFSGPQPLIGAPQTVQAAFGAWQIEISGLWLYSRGGVDRIALFDAIHQGILAQGLPIYMPSWSFTRGPRARADLPLFPSALFSDAASFSDLADFAQDTGDVIVAAPAAAQATQITVDYLSIASPTAGDFVTLGDRLYLITAAWPVAPAQWLWKITPPLRFAAAAGDAVNIALPFCRMVLSPKDRNFSRLLDSWRVSQVSLTFTEANWA
jgi:hypothetical protein